MRLDWLLLKRRPTETLPAVTENIRGQLRNVSGDGATTKDEVWFARNDAGTNEWVRFATSDDIAENDQYRSALYATYGGGYQLFDSSGDALYVLEDLE